MTTRRAQDGSPMRQEKYMSSPEFAELRGIGAVPTSARAALVDDAKHRELIWWLQGQSLQPGALKKLVRGLLDMFPERIGSASMVGKFRGKKTFSGDELYEVYDELKSHRARSIELERHNQYVKRLISDEVDLLAGNDGVARLFDESKTAESKSRTELIDLCRQLATEELDKFLVDVCINPRISIEANKDAYQAYTQEVQDRFSEIESADVTTATVRYFQDLTGAVQIYKDRQERASREGFALTAIGSEVWKALDHALARRGMVLIEGLEGRGKSAAAKAWVDAHSGVARFVSLRGVTGKTNVFRAIARALGIASGYGYKSNELQNRIEDVLGRSGIMLVVDESHFLFDLKPRIYSRPELIDWVDTALCNERIPVALISTPQLLGAAQQAAEQINWNYRQFRRRISRHVKLPEATSEKDLWKVAAKILPGVPDRALELAIIFTTARKLDVSGLADIAEEARIIAKSNGRERITFEDIDRAFNENLQPSDVALSKRLRSPAERRRAATIPACDRAEDAPALQRRGTSPAVLPHRVTTPLISEAKV